MSTHLIRSLFTITILFALVFFSSCGNEERESNCQIMPTCEAGEEEVPSCEGLQNCAPVTSCEQTIYCEGNPNEQEQEQEQEQEEQESNQNQNDTCTAMPICPDDRVAVESCESGEDCIEVTECQNSLLCKRSDESCENTESPCGTGEFVIDACPVGQEEFCTAFDDCGQTRYCHAPPISCDGIPLCDPGDTEVDSCPASGECYLRELCDQEILCLVEEVDPCDEDFTCPAGYSMVADAAGCTSSVAINEPGCFYVDHCDELQFCRSDQLFDCSQPVELCPPDYSTTASCDGEDGPCGTHLVCAEVEFCLAD